MQYIIFVVMAPIGAGILLFTMGAVLRYRKEPIGQILLLYLLIVMGILVVSILEILVPGKEMTFLFGRLFHLFFPFLPVVWIIFAMHYTGLIYSIKRRILLLLLIVPVITAVIVQTPLINGLFYHKVFFIMQGDYLGFKAVYGPWFWIAGVHSYVLLLAGAFIIIRSFLSSRKMFQVQSVFILIGNLLPLMVNLLYVFRVFSGWYQDFTSPAFALTGIFYFIGIYSHRFLHIVPVARNLVIKNLETAIIVFDNNARMVDYNSKAEEWFSISDNLLGTVLDNDSGLIKTAGFPAYKIPEKKEGSFTRDKNGIYYNFQIKRIISKKGMHIGTIISINDISRQINLLEEKTNTVKQLEHMNEELKKTQLHMIHREKLASIGQLSAGIAHELNNPLSYIKSNFTVLNRYRSDIFIKVIQSMKKDKDISSEEKKQIIESFDDINSIIDSSEEGIQRIINVVRSLLRFAREDTSDEVESFNLNNGIQSAVNITKSEFKYDAEIIMKLGELPPVECRSSEISQVFINILTNAAQATREASDKDTSKRIIIKSEYKNNKAFIKITNTGSSIPEEMRNKIFEPFYTTKKPGKGTGLGLSIAWDIIVKRHNGTISVKSADDITSFIIELPVKYSGV